MPKKRFVDKYSAIALLCALMTVGCSPSSTVMTNPKAPAEKYNTTSPMQLQKEQYISVVNVPIEIGLLDVEKQINAQLQGLLFEDTSYENDNNDNVKSKVWKRAPITVSAKDSLLQYNVPLRIWVSVGYKIAPLGFEISGFKESEFELDLKFITRFGISPDWQVDAKTVSAGFDWIKKPIIRVAGIEIPVAGVVGRVLNNNLPKYAGLIDANLRKNIDIKKYVSQAWNLLHEPNLLSEEFRTWLVVLPTDVLMTPFYIQNNVVKASLGIRGYTQTLTGVRPANAPSTLPNLKITGSIPQEFQIGVRSEISHDEVTQLAKQYFLGQKFDFKDGAYQVEVTDLSVYGQNDKLVIKSGLKGSIVGNIYFKGVPTFDPATSTIYLKDFDYDLETKNVLIKTASWLLQGRFKNQMQQQFRFPIGQQLSDIRKNIESTIGNRVLGRGIKLKGKLENMQPDQVYLTPNSLVSVLYIKGKLELKIDGLL